MAPPAASRRAWAAVVALSLAALAFVTTELLPIGLLTLMADDLDRSRSQVGQLVTWYAAVVVLFSVPLTRLTRRIPRRTLLGVTLGLFAAANLLVALAPSFTVLAGARLLIGLCQALFWSIAAAAVNDPFPPSARGRVVAVFSVGTALAPVLGVPAGTWLGQQAGWRAAFLAVAVVGVAVAVAVVLLVPSYPPQAGGAARGSAPDRSAFRWLVVATTLGVCGYLTFTTYVGPFLLDVTGLEQGALAPVLFASGLAGVAGTMIVGQFLDRRPVAARLTPLAVVAFALLALYPLGAIPVAAVALIALTGGGYSAYPAAAQHRMLQVAPASTDMASAWLSTAFNVGIAGGSLLGAALLPGAGARPLALIGGALVLAALTVLTVSARRTPHGESPRTLAETAPRDSR
ncbi:MFS transporter [Paractinoplanes atraurantiacus]|uniref:MFS transporter, DHA1 family, L-arabinose/isopropyl-beta-D-thiogalactopyranoside export protein/MFS transporter, DHA1 family, inner membrane transport protein n=1 Tax=Paractinoplanes atraurantiacus TaxID=1036182 RepID=A0A285JWW8_9ACTN|nr:MFS transporter [Actinoplanes atraurantiacus]SNY64805.1 MFS transporter, DHA1 family, L-arabinose/isopropyl-beta-D-thiogalactopyranoside export protein/MFS transporter, DHA1 family, inner membrane transport protein [Actinoplanes atraurantiacus]